MSNLGVLPGIPGWQPKSPPAVGTGQTIALIGASVTDFASDYAGAQDIGSGNRATYSNSPWPWVNVFLGHRMQLVYNGGVSGVTPQAIQVQATAVAALNPRPAYCLLGLDFSNGITINADTGPVTIAYLSGIVNTLLAAGIQVVLCTMVPRSDADLTVPEKKAIFEANDWIRQQMYKPGIVFCDTAAAHADSVTGDQKAGYTTDGIHPNTLGSMNLARVIADALSPRIVGSRPLVYTNIENRLVTLNPMMTGTAGTFGSGVTGTAPDSWVAAYVGTAATAVSSVVSRDDGGKWWQIKHTSTSTGNLWLLHATAPTTGYAVGDWVVTECEFETDDDWGTGVTLFYITTMFNPATGGSYDVLNNEATPPAMLNPVAGVLQTPPMQVPVGTTSLDSVLVLKGSQGTVRISRLCTRKLMV